MTTKNYAVIYHQILYQTLEQVSWHLGLKKLKKWYKNFQKILKKLQKLVSFFVFVFVVQKYIAHKMVITGSFVSQKTFIAFQKLQPWIIKNHKNIKNCTILSPKTPKNDLLTLN